MSRGALAWCLRALIPCAFALAPVAGGAAQDHDRADDPLPQGALLRLGTVRWRQGGRVTSVVVTPDGRSVLSGSSNMSVTMWDLATGRRKFVMEGHSGEICAVACSPDGRRAVSGGHDSKLIYWDLTTGK